MTEVFAGAPSPYEADLTIARPPESRSIEVRVAVAETAKDHLTVPVQGPHELAWVYLFDAVFAHAFRHGVDQLSFELPSDELLQMVTARAEATNRCGGRQPGRRGISLMAANSNFPEDVDYVYLLSYGLTAPPRLRRSPQPAPERWRLRESHSFFTLSARLMGVPIRLAYLLRREDLADRAMTLMRSMFAATGITPAYYHLTVWSRS